MESRKDCIEHLKFIKILEKNVGKYGEQILSLKDVEPGIKTEWSDGNWSEVDLTFIDDNYYTPLTIAIITLKDDPIKIEKMRIIEDSDVGYAFHQAVVDSSNNYAQLLLDLYGDRCFRNPHSYHRVLSMLTTSNNVKIMEAVCKILCEQGLQFALNFEHLKMNEKNGTLYPRTILLDAIENCSLDCIRVLLEYGAILYSDHKVDSMVELWRKIFSTTYPKDKLKSAIMSIITVMKNSYKLPDKSTLIKLFDEFIYHNQPFEDNLGNDKLAIAVNYLRYLIQNDEFHSLRHYSRNILRHKRIDDEWNRPVINSDEKQFFF